MKGSKSAPKEVQLHSTYNICWQWLYRVNCLFSVVVFQVSERLLTLMEQLGSSEEETDGEDFADV